MPANDYPLNSHGGAREGAGKKPGGYVKPQEAVDFDKAKVRTEVAKAEKLERENLVAEGLLVSRAAVQQAAATSYAALAQSLRSIPDELEREGFPADLCRKVEGIIDETMAGHAAQMELMAGTPAGTTQ
jgi:hypothetical protein